MNIDECAGYKALHATIIADTRSGRSETERMEKLQFAVDRAKHYEEKTGIPATKILNAWETSRNYWYMNFYQDCNQPLIECDSVRVFDTPGDLLASIGHAGFRCPCCHGVSGSPYSCNSGREIDASKGKPKTCDWKSYGLFGTLGKGIYVFVKSELRGEHIFMPILWEACCSQCEKSSPGGYFIVGDRQLCGECAYTYA